MKYDSQSADSDYVRIRYEQFNSSSKLNSIRKLFMYLCIPLVYPLVLMSKLSDFIFRTVSELLSIIPFMFGTIIRESFYRHALTACGENLSIGFGAILLYRDISIGSNVLIGPYCTIHHCDIGSDILIASGCRLLSGSRQHDFNRTDIPMSLQDGWIKKIKINNDVWIGSNAIIMEDIGEGSIIGAGSVVNKSVEDYSVCVGNPIRVVGKRK